MFLLKKIVGLCLSPVPLCLECLILGLVFLWATRRQRLGKVLVTLGTLLLVLLSLSVISSGLLSPLERRYPAILHPEQIVGKGQGPESAPRWIVVLGGGQVWDPRLPPNVQINDATLSRVIEGVRLYRAIPGSRLLFSGGRVFNPVPEAQVMAQVAMLLGVKAPDILLETDSWDTADQAEIIARMIGQEKFILVTSAFHMPRSVALFHKQGRQPLPAPTHHLVRDAQKPEPSRYFPGTGPLRQAQFALHEYLGLAWAWLRGLI